MRKSANWMVHADERILEYLDREGSASTWAIASDLHLRRGLTRDRLHMLAHVGWVEHAVDPYVDDTWSITTWGLGYLDCLVDANLVRPLPKLRPSYATRPGWWAGFG
jgi:DNA-binding IclR family transcriptional regulator